ncbi:MAG: polyprenyl synthetase family protein [Gammaproteobacteria bacterium]|nr:polyprenyl synthetase family protein [Gammaproteobacteria bacterium]MCP5139719.1 polyprenyl synthetase family protein [Chromatiales bacterium]
MTFDDRVEAYIARIEAVLDHYLPAETVAPSILHRAMRYSALSGGKRIRPLLVYATGEALGVSPNVLDAPAVAIELMHTFSLIHDDLPAMDNDDLRRGRPTAHRAFDEATAILAADAMQPLAFEVLATHPALRGQPATQVRLVALLADACGSRGMTGGQSMDMESEGKRLDPAELEHIYRLKTGYLLRASVLSAACCCADVPVTTLHRLERFVDALGLAFQVRDDIMDIEGSTEETGKSGGSDLASDKATYPHLFGMVQARERADELLKQAMDAIADAGPAYDGLRWAARYIVLRQRA